MRETESREKAQLPAQAAGNRGAPHVTGLTGRPVSWQGGGGRKGKQAVAMSWAAFVHPKRGCAVGRRAAKWVETQTRFGRR